MFDPEQFASMTTSEAGDTEYHPCPEGDWNAVLKSFETKVLDSGSVMMNVTWEVDAPGNDEADGKPVRQSIFLDITDSGALDMGKGKNTKLNRLRRALGQNTPGEPWSPSMMEGQVAVINVSHRMYEGETFADVKGVAPLN